MTISKKTTGLPAVDHRAKALQKAKAFTDFWSKKKHNRRQEARQFAKEFLEIFGLDFREAKLEHTLRGKSGNIHVDLFWPGELLLEMRTSDSAGFSGDAANSQAFAYVAAIDRALDTPKVVLVSDFNNLRIFDLRACLENGRWNGVRPEAKEFPLEQLTEESHFSILQFLVGREDLFCQGQLEVNQEAARQIGKLYTLLSEKKYAERDCTIFIMRVLFCLFAEDAHIFKKNAFAKYIVESLDHGQSIAARLGQLFETLNTREDERPRIPCPWDSETLDPVLQFPFINGELFADVLKGPPITDAEAKEYIVENCATLDWSKVSPTIFGALFQSIRTREDRRELGEHYTSIENIEKVIGPLFLDDLSAEFQMLASMTRDKKSKLLKFQEKLGNLQLLDPACGCGIFLIVAYERLRNLEYRVLRELYQTEDGTSQSAFTLARKVRLSQLHGIEIDLFPQMIAKTAAWLQDHLANERLSALVGKRIPRIPLTDTAHIVRGNALHVDWDSCFDDAKEKSFDYIFGNPPFNGARMMSKEQKEDMRHVFASFKGVGDLDYVTAWYWKAAAYMETHTSCETAFVSTSSITQGQQVALLWKPLLEKVLISFAYRAFKWKNEAKGRATVHCVIVGMKRKNESVPQKSTLWNEKGERCLVDTINGYLLDASISCIESRTKPICDIPEMKIGNKIIDDGNYIFTESQKDEFIQQEPKSKKYFHIFLGAREFMQGIVRYILLVNAIPPKNLLKMHEVLKRIDAVKKFREASKSKPTQKIADTPKEFHVTTMPPCDYIVVPKLSSERRKYIVVGICKKEIISSDLLFVIPSSRLYIFAILSSIVHMVWMKYVAGRFGNAYRYSASLVYNNFPWPKKSKNTSKIETLAQAILAARSAHPNSCLADLYDPLAMPDDLLHAHKRLDKAVLRLYGLKAAATEGEILEVLFARYADLTKGEYMPLSSK